MLFSKDMKDLLNLFRQHDVQYVLVGGHAVNYYGYVRTTQDIDLLVFPSKENAERIMTVLSRFGFEGAGIPQRLFEREGSAVHLGNEPNRIDILTGLKGVSNEEVFSGARTVDIDDMDVRIISLEHLLLAKRRSSRPRDLADADELSKINASD